MKLIIVSSTLQLYLIIHFSSFCCEIKGQNKYANIFTQNIANNPQYTMVPHDTQATVVHIEKYEIYALRQSPNHT